MATNFRRSQKVGTFRVTASKKGLGVSVGAGPVRVSRGPSGRVTRTVRVPGTGIYDTTVMNAGHGSTPRPAPAAGGSVSGAGPAGAGASSVGGGGGGDKDARNGCFGCLGLVVIAILILAGIGSCMGGSSSSPSKSSAPAPFVSSAAPTESTSSASPVSSSESSESETSSDTSSDETSSTSSDSSSSEAAASESSDSSSQAVQPTTQSSESSSAVACYPLTNSGGCYHIHEFCRKSDIGSSGVDVNGTPMTCVQNGKRGRWS